MHQANDLNHTVSSLYSSSSSSSSSFLLFYSVLFITARYFAAHRHFQPVQKRQEEKIEWKFIVLLDSNSISILFQ